MNSKYKFGLTEVIAMIIGSLIIVMLDLVFRENNVLYGDTIKSVLVVIFAALFGAPTGIVIAVASSLLLAAILRLDVSIVVVMVYVLIALAVGHYASFFGIREGAFKGKKILIFALTKLGAEIFAWLFFLPLLNFLVTRNNLYDFLYSNMITVLMLTATDAVVIPVFILVSHLFTKKDK